MDKTGFSHCTGYGFPPKVVPWSPFDNTLYTSHDAISSNRNQIQAFLPMRPIRLYIYCSYANKVPQRPIPV